MICAQKLAWRNGGDGGKIRLFTGIETSFSLQIEGLRRMSSQLGVAVGFLRRIHLLEKYSYYFTFAH
jgi:hypothetical protein